MYYYDMGYAVLDTTGNFARVPGRVIFCPGKTTTQRSFPLRRNSSNSQTKISFATGPVEKIYQALVAEIPSAEFNESSRTIVIRKGEQKECRQYPGGIGRDIRYSCSGRSRRYREVMGNKGGKNVDTGVAGLHRLFAQSERLLEGASRHCGRRYGRCLPSVIGGLVSKPVIAVPTA
jgi:NCAIR mutase (PurE)-related protein